MNTLFNINEIQQAEQIRQSSNNRYDKEMSKISRPNLRGIASYESAKQALRIALAGIITSFCGHANILSQETFNNGTAQILAEVWEDGESVLYQFDIDENGDYCEIRLS